MGVLIILAGVLQIAGGFIVMAAAKSAVHEILGTLSIGMGVLSFALGIVINQLSSIRGYLKTLAERNEAANSRPMA